MEFGSDQGNLVNTAQELYRKSIAIQVEKTNAIAKSIRDERRDAVLMQGAKANIEQVGLLEKQLEEVKQQNAQLKENYALLKDLYDRAKKDAEESAKDAKKNRVFGWVSFAVGTLIGIVGVVLGIIF